MSDYNQWQRPDFGPPAEPPLQWQTVPSAPAPEPPRRPQTGTGWKILLTVVCTVVAVALVGVTVGRFLGVDVLRAAAGSLPATSPTPTSVPTTPSVKTPTPSPTTPPSSPAVPTGGQAETAEIGRDDVYVWEDNFKAQVFGVWVRQSSNPYQETADDGRYTTIDVKFINDSIATVDVTLCDVNLVYGPDSVRANPILAADADLACDGTVLPGREMSFTFAFKAGLADLESAPVMVSVTPNWDYQPGHFESELTFDVSDQEEQPDGPRPNSDGPVGSESFEYFTVTAYERQDRDMVVGYWVQVCVNKLPPDTEGDAVRVSRWPWTFESSDGVHEAEASEIFGEPYPYEVYLMVGECVDGWLTYDAGDSGALPDSLHYANSLGETADF